MQESQVTYATYPEYKTIHNFEFMVPIEMPEDIVNDIIFCISSNDKLTPSELVETVRKLLDNKHGIYWHVFCGKNFGSYSVHDRNRFLFFKYKSISYLVYKTSY